MTETRRNALIGLFVLGGLVCLGTLIVWFGETRGLLSRGYLVTVKFDRVTGIRDGLQVTLAGVPVGRVQEVGLENPKDPSKGVVARLNIEADYEIPDGSRVVVSPPLMGQPSIDILPPEVPTEPLPTDGTAVLHGRVGNPLEQVVDPQFIAQLGKTTAQIGDLAEALKPAANAVTDLLEQRSIRQVESPSAPEDMVANLYTAVERIHNVAKHIETVLGDPANQSNLKLALANFRDASEEAKAAAAGFRQLSADARVPTTRAAEVLDNLNETITVTRGHIDRIGTELVTNTEKLSKIMDYGVKVGAQAAEGQGTIALLLRDPKFYEELLLTTQRLGDAANELKVLIVQWQRDGLISSLK